MEVFRGEILRCNDNDGFEHIPDGVISVEDEKIGYAGPSDRYNGAKPAHSGDLATLPSANTHCHTFQPPAVEGVLMDNSSGEWKGWLPTTLQFETAVKENPELARAIAREKFESYIAHGITASLEYTTSSADAARITLEVAEELGLKGRIKVGYVCMNQDVNFLTGVRLETSIEEALAETENLLRDFPGQVVVIDRFPIAVSSELRKKLVDLARRFDAPYETHVDESQGEYTRHQELYGERIMRTLEKDGVLSLAQVGLAHGIHTSVADFQLLESAIMSGTQVDLRACPNSNGQLKSNLWNGVQVPFPLNIWEEVGARVSLGLDRGAGRGLSIFAEALSLRARANTRERVPSALDLFSYATVNGLESLGLEARGLLKPGAPADFIVTRPLGASFSAISVPSNPAEKMAGLVGRVIQGAQSAANIKGVVVNGRELK